MTVTIFNAKYFSKNIHRLQRLKVYLMENCDKLLQLENDELHDNFIETVISTGMGLDFRDKKDNNNRYIMRTSLKAYFESIGGILKVLYSSCLEQSLLCIVAAYLKFVLKTEYPQKNSITIENASKYIESLTIHDSDNLNQINYHKVIMRRWLRKAHMNSAMELINYEFGEKIEEKLEEAIVAAMRMLLEMTPFDINAEEQIYSLENVKKINKNFVNLSIPNQYAFNVLQIFEQSQITQLLPINTLNEESLNSASNEEMKFDTIDIQQNHENHNNMTSVDSDSEMNVEPVDIELLQQSKSIKKEKDIKLPFTSKMIKNKPTSLRSYNVGEFVFVKVPYFWWLPGLIVMKEAQRLKVKLFPFDHFDTLLTLHTRIDKLRIYPIEDIDMNYLKLVSRNQNKAKRLLQTSISKFEFLKTKIYKHPNLLDDIVLKINDSVMEIEAADSLYQMEISQEEIEPLPSFNSKKLVNNKKVKGLSNYSVNDLVFVKVPQYWWLFGIVMAKKENYLLVIVFPCNLFFPLILRGQKDVLKIYHIADIDISYVKKLSENPKYNQRFLKSSLKALTNIKEIKRLPVQSELWLKFSTYTVRGSIK